MGRSCPKNSNINETFQQAPWKAKIEGWVWLVVADVSGSERLFLRSGNDVPVNLYRWMLLSVLIRKGKVPRHTFHRPRSQSWLRGSRSQLAAPSGTGFQGLPCYHPWGRQACNSTDPQSPQLPKWGDPVPQTDSYGRPLLLGHRDRGEGEVHCCLKGWAKASGGLMRPLEPCRMEPQSVPWALHSPTDRRLGNLEGLPEKAWVCLLPHSPLGYQNPTDPWLNRFPSGPSLTVTSEQGSLWCWPIVEQDN